MKKRMFAMLLIFVMIFQALPVMAEETIKTINVYDAATLFSLNDNLNANVEVTQSFTVNIDQEFVNRYGAWYIGNASNPFLGDINGNGNTITLNVDTTVADWALFHTLYGSSVSNLKINLNSFHSSSSDENVSVAVLAQDIQYTNLRNLGLTLTGVSNQKMFDNKLGRSIDIGTAAITASANNYVSISSGKLDLIAVPDNASVRAGAVAKTKKVNATDNSLTIYNSESYKTYVYANDSDYTVGSAVGEISSETVVGASGAGQTYFLDYNTFNILNKKNNPDVVIGGSVGLIQNGAGASINGDLDLYLNTWGASDNLSAGAAVGTNYGVLEVSYATTMLSSSDSDNKVSFVNGFNGTGSNIHVGGVVGTAGGNTIIHSNGVNMKLYGTDVQKSAFDLGLFVGASHGQSTKIEDNGSSLYSEEIMVDSNDSLGTIIGKDYGTDYLGIQYNIINATNEKSLKADYDWISTPVGNININQSIDLFKNNYWAYMGYAKLNTPTQIYFTIPMNYYGDRAPLETDSNYPFIAKYSYLYPTQETNKYLTFQNPSERGIGTVLLTQDCLASVKVSFQILPEYAEEYWGGHYYRNADVLNYLGLGEDDEDEGDDGLPSEPGRDPFIPGNPPSDEDGDKELVETFYYTKFIEGKEYSCYRNEWTDGTWDESCILINQDDLEDEPDDDIPGDDVPPKDTIYDTNHDKPGYTCTFHETEDAIYETCVKNEDEIIYDKNHGKTGYKCYFNQRNGKWYETCEKEEPDYVYDRNHGKSGYYCYFDKIGNTYYETCEKEDEYVYDKNHGKAGYTCEFNYKNGKYVETCTKEDQYVYDKNHGKSGYVCEFEYKSGKYYEACEKKDENIVYDKNHGQVGYVCYLEPKNGKQYETCVKENQFVKDKNHDKAGYVCTVKYTSGKYKETCEREEDVTPEGWDKDFVRSGFSQAVINKGKYAGSPLPTFTENNKSEVTFNYYDLPYEIKYTNKSFSDIKGNRFEEEIIEAANRLIVQGYGDGKFGPDKAITRAEFATMVVRTLGLIPSGSARFTDVTEGAWYYDFVNTAADWGIVVGIGNDLFAPEKNITRQEAAIMLMRAAKILEEHEFEADRKQLYEVEFYGWEDSAMWARTEVIESVLYGVVDLRDGHQFAPLENITRAETASALLNLLKNYELINK